MIVLKVKIFLYYIILNEYFISQFSPGGSKKNVVQNFNLYVQRPYNQPSSSMERALSTTLDAESECMEMSSRRETHGCENGGRA